MVSLMSEALRRAGVPVGGLLVGVAGGEDGRSVQRFDGVQAEDAGREALVREEIRGEERVDLWYDRGRPVFARTSGLAVRSGELLMHRGTVSASAGKPLGTGSSKRAPFQCSMKLTARWWVTVSLIGTSARQRPTCLFQGRRWAPEWRS